jgi:CBS domain-containing protein
MAERGAPTVRFDERSKEGLMKISEVMTTDVETISSEQTAREAAGFMLRADAGSIPVCENGRVIGMITDRDIAVRGVAEGRGPDTPVSELMSDGIICAHEDEDVDSVVQKMSEAQVRRLPVLDSDEKLVGIVSLGDLTRETSGEAAHEALEGISAPGGMHQQ